MSIIGNIIWLIFGGLLTSIGYVIGGLLLCLTIIGVPFGIQAIRYGVAVAAPFGKSVQHQDTNGFLAAAFNIIWILLFGWEIMLIHVISALILGITIVGIPFARQHLKLIPMALLPFSYKLKAE